MAAQPPLPTGKSVSMTLWPGDEGPVYGPAVGKGPRRRARATSGKGTSGVLSAARVLNVGYAAPSPCSCPRASRSTARPETPGGTMERCSVISLSRHVAKNCPGRELVALLYEHASTSHFFFSSRLSMLMPFAMKLPAMASMAWQRTAYAVEDAAYHARGRGGCTWARSSGRRAPRRLEPAGVLVDLDDALLPGGGDDLAEEPLLAHVYKAHARQAAPPRTLMTGPFTPWM